MAKVKKTRIYQEPDFTGTSGYVMADGGANKPTGKISFNDFGKLLGSNPLIIVFVPDGQGSYTMYRQTTFEMNVQPQLEPEPIDFAWLYENVYKVMVCAAIIQNTEHNGNPIFFFSGMYSDTQTNEQFMEFTRFDTTEDEVVTEHSILVSTDAPYPYTGGNTIITERYVTIDQSDFEYIIDQTDSSSGAPARIWAKCEAYIAKSLDYRNTHRLMFVESYDSSPYLKYYEYAGKKNGYHYFYRFSPAALLPNGQDEKGLIDVLKVSSSGVWYYHQTGEEFATELWVSNNYVPLSARNCAIGNSVTATNYESFAQGYNCSADSQSMAQGSATSALNNSFAQGNTCIAVNNSFAQGSMCSAENGQAFGDHTVISGGLAVGAYNQTSSNVAMVIGNGYYDSVNNSACRSDLFIVSSDGTVSAKKFVEEETPLTITGGDYVSVTEDSTNNKLIIDLESSLGQMITELSGVLTTKPSTGRHILGVDNGSLTWLEVNQ